MKLKQFIVLLLTAFLILLFGFTLKVKAQNQVNAMQKTIEQLSDQSDLVVVGKVSEIHSKWNKDKSRIYTDVTVDVEEFVKGGESGRTIVVTHPGGEVGGVGEWYSYAPKFTKDEEVLLFAKRDKENNLQVTQGQEGKFRITKDEVTGKKKVGSFYSLNDLSSRIKSIIKK